MTTMMMGAPEHTLTQRMDALEHANRVRRARAELKRDIKAGRRSASRLLVNPPEELWTMRVCDLLCAIPKYGRVKVRKTLTQCAISPSKTIGGLTDRQRTELAAAVRT